MSVKFKYDMHGHLWAYTQIGQALRYIEDTGEIAYTQDLFARSMMLTTVPASAQDDADFKQYAKKALKYGAGLPILVVAQ